MLGRLSRADGRALLLRGDLCSDLRGWKVRRVLEYEPGASNDHDPMGRENAAGYDPPRSVEGNPAEWSTHSKGVDGVGPDEEVERAWDRSRTDEAITP
jgi:hypothetical protein